jgi:YfiH family protein
MPESAGKAWLSADWRAPANVHALQTLRAPLGASKPPFDRFNLGDRCGDEADAVASNRALLRRAAGLPGEPRWLRQVHGVQVVRFDAAQAAAEPPLADASITKEAGVVLAILTADCLPVVFAADDGSEVAAAHAGWRGLAVGVLEATVQAMHTPAERVVAWLGAAAGPSAYEVGEEVRDAFVGVDDSASAAFAATRSGHWHADLYALARQRLAAAGVTRVAGGGLCTISDRERFFSHRRDGTSGRMATLVWMDPRG